MPKFEITQQLVADILTEAIAAQLVDIDEPALKAEVTSRLAFAELVGKRKLQDMQASTLKTFEEELQLALGEKSEVSIKANKQTGRAWVEAKVDGRTLKGSVALTPPKEPKPKFEPFPIATTGDPELVWELARIETLTDEEAKIALLRVEEEFWVTKKGQKLLSKKVPKVFAEFIDRVPSKALVAAGLKRHYKQPGVTKQVTSEAHKPTTETRYAKDT